MFELHNADYTIVLPLMRTIRSKAVYAHSVIENVQPGKIFVNCKEDPKSCLIASRGGKYIVVGDNTDSEFNRDLCKYLSDKRNHNIYYDLYASSDEWIDLLQNQLVGQTVTLSHTSFEFNESKFFNQKIKVPEEFMVLPMNGKLFEQHQNSDRVDYWGTKDNFLLHGIGFCVVIEDQIVCRCISGFVGNGRAEIDIYTHESYRNRGLAKLLCSVFINYCLTHRLVPNWGCDTGNKASARLATSLGFEKTNETKMLWWHEDSEVISDYLKMYSYKP